MIWGQPSPGKWMSKWKTLRRPIWFFIFHVFCRSTVCCASLSMHGASQASPKYGKSNRRSPRCIFQNRAHCKHKNTLIWICPRDSKWCSHVFKIYRLRQNPDFLQICFSLADGQFCWTVLRVGLVKAGCGIARQMPLVHIVNPLVAGATHFYSAKSLHFASIWTLPCATIQAPAERARLYLILSSPKWKPIFFLKP